MPRRQHVSLALFAALALWASGADRFIHEVVAHGGHAHDHLVAEVGHPGHLADSASADDDDAAQHHDHDHCPTCLLLAALRTPGVSIPTPVAVPEPTAIAPLPRIASPDRLHRPVLPPARAPPTKPA